MMKQQQCSIVASTNDFVLHADFVLPTHGVLGIFGHSGSGKTTLLRCIAGLEKNITGNITFHQQQWLDHTHQLSTQDRRIGYVFQESRLFSHLTVKENIEYGEKRAEKLTQKDKNNLLQLLNIESLLSRYPSSLSGGEKQRVAIARALCKNPQILLMDEPLASLDETHKHEILSYLEKLHDQLKIPMIYVSHSIEEVSRLCDQLMVLEKGKIIFSGTITEALTKSNSPLLTTQHAVAVFNSKVISCDTEFSLSLVETESGTPLFVKRILNPGNSIRVRVCASDISLCKDRPAQSSILNILPAILISVAEETQSEMLLCLQVNEDMFLSRISKKSFAVLSLQVGAEVYIQIKGVLL